MLNRLINHFFISSIVSVLLLKGALISATPLPERGGKDLEKGIDVILVMDSSGSMKKTDPLTMRIPAARLFVSLLYKEDRAGVVSFSDKGYPLAYLTALDSEGEKEKVLKAIDKVSSKGLYTNLYEALRKGIELLSENREEQRPGIIILMSDGKMDVGSQDRDKILIDRLKKELLDDARGKGIRVYTIAFTEYSDRKLLEDIAVETKGFSNLALTDKDLYQIFSSIFESIKRPEMLPMEGERFLVDNSIKEVTIVATKGSPDTTIYLISPDGKRYSSKDRGGLIKWFESHNFDMITVKEPQPGEWRLRFTTGKGNRAYIITNLKLMTNGSDQYLAPGKAIPIEAWLEKDNSILQEREVLEQVYAFINLSRPDGESTRFALLDDGAGVDKESGDGIFSGKVIIDKIGTYELTIVAKGKTFERKKTFKLTVSGDKEVEKKDSIAPPAPPEPVKQAYMPPLKEPPVDDPKNEYSLKVILFKFILINLLALCIGGTFLKRKRLMGLLQSFREGKRDDKD